MNPSDAAKKAVDWKGQTWAQRLDSCALLLSAHGFLTEAEDRRVNDRIEKWAAKGGVRRTPIHTCDERSYCDPCDKGAA